MRLPERNELGLPVLEALSDGAEHTTHEIRAQVAARFSLSLDSLSRVLDAERREFSCRVALAIVVLQANGAVVRLGQLRAQDGTEVTDIFRITPSGEQILRTVGVLSK